MRDLMGKIGELQEQSVSITVIQKDLLRQRHGGHSWNTQNHV